jgi:hypothetical protein
MSCGKMQDSVCADQMRLSHVRSSDKKIGDVNMVILGLASASCTRNLTCPQYSRPLPCQHAAGVVTCISYSASPQADGMMAYVW